MVQVEHHQFAAVEICSLSLRLELLTLIAFSSSAHNNHWQQISMNGYHTYDACVCDKRSDQNLGETSVFPSNPQKLHASMHLSASAGCAKRKQLSLLLLRIILFYLSFWRGGIDI